MLETTKVKILNSEAYFVHRIHSEFMPLLLIDLASLPGVNQQLLRGARVRCPLQFTDLIKIGKRGFGEI